MTPLGLFISITVSLCTITFDVDQRGLHVSTEPFTSRYSFSTNGRPFYGHRIVEIPKNPVSSRIRFELAAARVSPSHSLADEYNHFQYEAFTRKMERARASSKVPSYDEKVKLLMHYEKQGWENFYSDNGKVCSKIRPLYTQHPFNFSEDLKWTLLDGESNIYLK